MGDGCMMFNLNAGLHI